MCVDLINCYLFSFDGMDVQTRAGAAWQRAVYQTGFQQQSIAGASGAGVNSGGIGKLLISNLDFGVNDADIKV